MIQKQESCSFNIIAPAGSKKACRTISQSIQAYIMSLYDPVADTYGAHQVYILKNTISTLHSTSVLLEQIDMKYQIGALRTETCK